MTSFIEYQIHKTAKMVKRWHGYPAKIRSLTESHACLNLLVCGEVYGENLLIACGGPIHIHGPADWANSYIEIELIILEDGEEGVVIFDKMNDVRIVAETFSIFENVKKY